LISARTAAGLTQQELAVRIGRQQTFVSKYEIGERRIELVELLDICAALGIDPHKVITELLMVSQGGA
jgi:transcriptional regulator with XRE-family HTH domain